MTSEASSGVGQRSLADGTDRVAAKAVSRDRLAGFVRRQGQMNWALLDQALVSACNFATGVLVARGLGIAEFGRFTLVWTVVLLLGALQHAAINTPMLSIGPKQLPARAPAYYGAVVVQQAVFAATSFSLVLIGARLAAICFPQWGIDGMSLPLALAASLWHGQDFVRRCCFARGRAARAMFNDLISYGGQVGVLFIVLRDHGGVADATTVLCVIAATCAVAIAHGALAMTPLAWSLTVFRSVVSRHFRFACWMVGTAAFAWIQGAVPFLAAGAVLGPVAVGALRAAQNLVGVIHILFLGLENAAPAAAARAFSTGGVVALRQYLGRVGLVGGLATLAFALVLVLAPNFWMALAFGSNYTQYAYLLLWFAPLYLLMYVSITLRIAFRTLEVPRPMFVAHVAGSAVMLAIAYPLLLRFGLSGLMLSWIAGHAALQLWLWRAVGGVRPQRLDA